MQLPAAAQQKNTRLSISKKPAGPDLQAGLISQFMPPLKIHLALVMLCVGCCLAKAGGPPAAPKPALGINLAGPEDWNTELPFVDVFHLSREWISQHDHPRQR